MAVVELGFLTESLLAEASWTREGWSSCFTCATSNNTSDISILECVYLYVCLFVCLFVPFTFPRRCAYLDKISKSGRKCPCCDFTRLKISPSPKKNYKYTKNNFLYFFLFIYQQIFVLMCRVCGLTGLRKEGKRKRKAMKRKEKKRPPATHLCLHLIALEIINF